MQAHGSQPSGNACSHYWRQPVYWTSADGEFKSERVCSMCGASDDVLAEDQRSYHHGREDGRAEMREMVRTLLAGKLVDNLFATGIVREVVEWHLNGELPIAKAQEIIGAGQWRKWTPRDGRNFGS